MEFIPVLIIIVIGLYFVLRAPRCPHCGAAMAHRNRNNPFSMMDDRWVCDNCGGKQYAESDVKR